MHCIHHYLCMQCHYGNTNTVTSHKHVFGAIVHSSDSESYRSVLDKYVLSSYSHIKIHQELLVSTTSRENY